MVDGKILIEKLLRYAENFLHLNKRDEIFVSFNFDYFSRFFKITPRVDKLIIPTTNNDKSFFNTLNYLINESKLSLRQVFKEMEICIANYFRWRDGVIPKTSVLIDMAKYFNVGLDYLVGNKKD